MDEVIFARFNYNVLVGHRLTQSAGDADFVFGQTGKM
jgi:hypothetical protein